MKYAIGIGGTGSKCIEALVHLCAAGLGPDKLSIFFIDPDKNNGNLNKAKEAIDSYRTCRQMLLNKTPQAQSLFKTDIQILEGQDAIWKVYEKDGTKLRDKLLYTRGKPDADIIDVLYTGQELDMLLDKGFQAHPSIGAVVMTGGNENKQPWTQFWNDLQSVDKPFGGHVFMFGSVFGGTGASGLPTLSTVIGKDKRNYIDENKRKIRLGAALLLPYFTATRKANSPEITTYSVDGYPLASKAALLYYADKDNLGFDDIYMIGAPERQSVGDQVKGGSLQKNDAHYAELIAALASIDFFGTNTPVTSRNHFIARKGDGSDIKWDTLPFGRSQHNLSRQNDIKRLLSILTTFAFGFYFYASKTVYGGFDARSEHRQPWYRNNFELKKSFLTGIKEGQINIRDNAHQQGIDKINDYCQKYLGWLKDISNEASMSFLNKAAIESIFNPERNIETKLFSLKDYQEIILEGSEHARTIGVLLNHSVEGSTLKNTIPLDEKSSPFSIFRSKLNEIDLSQSGITGLSRLVCLVYQGAEKFSLENYGLSQ
ncbi:MAG: hypothetical protein WCK85_06280 [Chlorobium sp.]